VESSVNDIIPSVSESENEVNSYPTQGGLANKSGISFEKELTRMMNSRYTNMGTKYKKKKQSTNPCEITFKNNDHQIIKVYPQCSFIDCYNNKSFMDFMIAIHDIEIWIECKYQQSEGSVYTKIPYSCKLLNHLHSSKRICVYLSSGDIYKKTRIQNITRVESVTYPNIRFIHVDTDTDYDILFDIINDILRSTIS
jgi:hypothetical protein